MIFNSHKRMLLIFLLIVLTFNINKSNLVANPWDTILQYPYIETDDPDLLDSLRNFKGTLIPSSCFNGLYSNILFPIYGNLLWTDINTIRLSSDTTKYQTRNTNLFENGYILFDNQIDVKNKIEEYCDSSSYIGSKCDSLWDFDCSAIINNDQIYIKAENDAFVEVYEAYHIGDTYLARFQVPGNNIEYIYYYNFVAGKNYIIAFRNNKNEIINVKRIMIIK